MEILYALVTAIYMGGGQGYEFAYSHPTLLTENECRVISRKMNHKSLKAFSYSVDSEMTKFYCVPTADVTLFKKCNFGRANETSKQITTIEEYRKARACNMFYP